MSDEQLIKQAERIKELSEDIKQQLFRGKCIPIEITPCATPLYLCGNGYYSPRGEVHSVYWGTVFDPASLKEVTFNADTNFDHIGRISEEELAMLKSLHVEAMGPLFSIYSPVDESEEEQE